MIDLPAPLTTPETDVRDLAGFMLNVERLMASELWALSTPEEFKAAVALWCRAWKQVPAGSLPKDDRTLSAFSGAGPRWRKIKDMALRGFIECSDGRLYNRTLCEDATRAYRKKIERRERTKAATNARKKERDNDRDDIRDDAPHDERDVDRDEHVTRSHRRDETRRDESKISSLRSESVKTRAAFAEFWSAYPRRDGANPKLPAEKKFIAAVKSGVNPAEIIAGAKAYAASVAGADQRYVAQAVTWLNQARWMDDHPLPASPRPPNGAIGKRNPSIALFEQARAGYDESADEPYLPEAATGYR